MDLCNPIQSEQAAAKNPRVRWISTWRNDGLRERCRTWIASNGSLSVKNVEPSGLTSDEAKVRLDKDGPNAMPDTSAHPLRNALTKFWAPVPWLLEAAILLQVGLHKYLEAAVITGLLIFNAALAWFQEGRARATSLL